MEWLIGLASVAVAFFTAKLTVQAEEERFREEINLDYSIETAIVHLLKNPSYKKRSFGKIKRHRRGFKDDDDLQMASIRSGAVAFGGDGDDEKWGLLDRNREDIK